MQEILRRKLTFLQAMRLTALPPSTAGGDAVLLDYRATTTFSFASRIIRPSEARFALMLR